MHTDPSFVGIVKPWGLGMYPVWED